MQLAVQAKSRDPHLSKYMLSQIYKISQSTLRRRITTYNHKALLPHASTTYGTWRNCNFPTYDWPRYAIFSTPTSACGSYGGKSGTRTRRVTPRQELGVQLRATCPRAQDTSKSQDPLSASLQQRSQVIPGLVQAYKKYYCEICDPRRVRISTTSRKRAFR